MSRRIVTHREQFATLYRNAGSALYKDDDDDEGDYGGGLDPNNPTHFENDDEVANNPTGGSPHRSAPSTLDMSNNGHGAPGSAGSGHGGGGMATGRGSGGGGGGVTGTPGGGPPSASLTEALQRAGIDPAMYPLISGFSATEGNNPSGAPTLGFTDSQAGTSLDSHAQALSKQLQDRQSVAGPFPHGGSPADQASWMATVVGQNGVSSDWQGNAQPARSDYVTRIVNQMPTAAPPVQTAPVTPTPPTQNH